MKHIISTMTNAVAYTFWGKAGDLPVPVGKITIQGGANLPSLSSGFGEMTKDGEGKPLWTPQGVVTPISDEAYEKLKGHVVFQKHLDKGFVKVLEREPRGHKDVSRVVKDMPTRDEQSQITPGTLKNYVRNLKVKETSKEFDSQDSLASESPLDILNT